jgi:hypothetical protein
VNIVAEQAINGKMLRLVQGDITEREAVSKSWNSAFMTMKQHAISGMNSMH